MEIERDDRRCGPVNVKLKTNDGREISMRLTSAPLRLTWTNGKLRREFELFGIDDRGRLVYAPVPPSKTGAAAR
jgi:hypothetical protein